MHAHHENLPGYDAGNIWHDGCTECEDRARDPLDGLTSLDHQNFRQAWSDMLDAKWSGGVGLTRCVSECDWRLLSALYAIAVLFEKATGQDPRDTLTQIRLRSEVLEARLAEMFGGMS